jgi:hypothetical protein
MAVVADAKRQREDRDEREARVLAELPKRAAAVGERGLVRRLSGALRAELRAKGLSVSTQGCIVAGCRRG